MLYIVNVSGGLTSFEALRRTVDKHGKECVRAVFADTRMEDADLYRFLDDQERYFGIEITRLQEGRTPWEVLRDERCITMQSATPCSKILKRQLIDRWPEDNFPDTEYTRVFGMDWSEQDRMDRLRGVLAPKPVWFPLAEKPYVTKKDIARFLEDVGIAVPFLYTQGFEHNNCGGGCTRAGQAHWAHLLRVLPSRYRAWEAWEDSMRSSLGKEIAIMKRQRNGAVAPLSLRVFRQEIEAGKALYDDDLWGGCGCFVGE